MKLLRQIPSIGPIRAALLIALTQFFPISKVIAAIFRARVRRAVAAVTGKSINRLYVHSIFPPRPRSARFAQPAPLTAASADLRLR
jgi:hypothetical protein